MHNRRRRLGEICRIAEIYCKKEFTTGDRRFDLCPYCKGTLNLRFYFERDNSGKYESYVLVEEENVMGILCIQKRKNSLYLSRIGVLEGFHTRGYGYQMMMYTIEKTMAWNKKKITCEVHEDVINWFSKLGFKRIRSYCDTHWGKCATMEYKLR